MKELDKAKKAYHAALRERAKVLKAELAEIEGILRTKRVPHNRTSPCKNPENETVWNICRGALDANGPYMVTEELLKALEKAGSPIFGKNPTSTLYHRLRRNSDFRYGRNLGWSLAHA